jgi:hypothetical protein
MAGSHHFIIDVAVQRLLFTPEPHAAVLAEFRKTSLLP